MKSAVITGHSGRALQLLLELARAMGMKSRLLTEEEMEDAGLAKAIREGMTKKFAEATRLLNSR